MTTILKCKMCGGTLEIQENETVARCKYCGSLMTLPKVDSEKKARIFNRANEYRLNNEFDEAYDAYRSIVEEDPTEAEAYWGMILSERGIEYVEDPKIGKRIPTCHRTINTPIQNSTNYQMALKYADSERRMMYQDEAKVLDKLQRNILSVSSREEPYDVFISYKETDDLTGERTEDSVIAQDIYNELTRAGIRTFFSRVSLEDHLGENYEPYIYAALQSSKILITVSTTGEHIESTWVKNEWMRFLHMMDEDKTKMIIPVYKGMSPYELPAVLSGYQAQDMSKIGAVQDLVRGVQRILGKKELSEKDMILNRMIEEKRREEENERKKAEEERIRKQKEAEAIRIQEIKEAERKEKWRKNRKYYYLGAAMIAVCVIAALIYMNVILPRQRLNEAISLFKSGNNDEGYSLLNKVSKNTLIDNYKLEQAEKLISDGDYEIGYLLLEQVGNNERISSDKYDRAVKMMEAGEYEAAYNLMSGLNYKDSEEKVGEIISARLSNANAGDLIPFGSFDLDGVEDNGKENLSWMVLAKENDKALLLSEYGIGTRAYHNTTQSVSWENSDIRKWLNEDFVNNAFSSKEQNMISSTTTIAEKNPSRTGVDQGKDTIDKAFLLSISEVDLYLQTNEQRVIQKTNATAKEADLNHKYAWWWLRTLGDSREQACFVEYTGRISTVGYFIGDDEGVVRPALWVRFS